MLRDENVARGVTMGTKLPPGSRTSSNTNSQAHRMSRCPRLLASLPPPHLAKLRLQGPCHSKYTQWADFPPNRDFPRKPIPRRTDNIKPSKPVARLQPNTAPRTNPTPRPQSMNVLIFDLGCDITQEIFIFRRPLFFFFNSTPFLTPEFS